MNLKFRVELADEYHSKSQIARVLTEDWIAQNMFCPRCGNLSLEHFANNKPVADFFCPQCAAQYELKSKEGKMPKKINDGAYDTMIRRINSNENPDFFFMSYSLKNFCVEDLVIIPKHFFVPDIIEKRKPLAPTAKRAGWIGCNILVSAIPEQGRISIIQAGEVKETATVVNDMQRAQRLQISSIKARGWLLDVLNCVNAIPSNEFTLADVYRFENLLAKKHPSNHNIQAKIRQQLQVLRDKDIIQFIGKGKYMKIIM